VNPSRPFRDDDAPGRIPESLIDSVLDGAVDERTKREVARALRHDPRRRQDVAETIEALNALRHPVVCPDISAGVLSTLDRKHRFLSPGARRLIRRTRVSGMLAVLVGLVAVAGVQRAVPRFSSLSAQPTPVTDVARAVQADTAEAAGQVRDGVRIMQASLPSLSATLDMPGRAYRTGTDTQITEAAAMMERRFRLVTLDGGRYFIIEPVSSRAAAGTGRGGFVATMFVTGDQTTDADEGASDPLP
jgi:hypothetical protein